VRKDAIKEIDLHLYIPEFARVAVDEFASLYRQATREAKRS
jgi:uncharacterized protein (UPF0261 family)